MNPPTPWPPEMATGENPPDGAILDYYLSPGTTGPVMLEVLDAKGMTVARFRSTDPVPPFDPRYPDPVLWARPPRILSAAAGHHRFLWDMHYPEVPGMSTGPDASMAVPYDTPAVASSPWVQPGQYTVRLTAGGKALTQPLTVVLDPRVKTPTAELARQFSVSKAIYDDMLHATQAMHEISVIRDQMKPGVTKLPADTAAATMTKLNLIAGGERSDQGRRGGPAGPPNLGSIRTGLARMEHSIQNADEAPTAAQVEAYQIVVKPLAELLAQWDAMKKSDLKALNVELRQKHLPLLSLNTHKIDHDVEDQIEIGDID